MLCVKIRINLPGSLNPFSVCNPSTSKDILTSGFISGIILVVSGRGGGEGRAERGGKRRKKGQKGLGVRG